MASAPRNTDRPTNKVVIATQMSITLMKEQIADVQARHEQMLKDRNAAAARIYGSVVAALRELIAAGPSGTTYAELQMKVKLSSGRPGLSRQEQEEVMRLVRGHVTVVQKKSERKLRDEEASKTVRARAGKPPQGGRVQPTRSLARERLEQGKLR